MRTHTTALLLTLAATLVACGGDDDAPDRGALDANTPLAGGATNPLPTPLRRVPDCSQALPPGSVSSGERHTVAGTIVSIDSAKDARGAMTLLQFAAPGGEQPVAIAIASGAREAFPAEIAELYVGKNVCVNGVVIEVVDRRVIFVDTPSEIVVM